MKKFYIFIFFISITFFASAQDGRGINVNATNISDQIKVLKFYPNPATSVINFEFQKPVQKELTLQVFNFVGKKIFELSNISQKTMIPLTEFFRGVYIFQLRDKFGHILESGKFQVNK